MLPEGPGRWWPLGGPPQWVLQTLWAPMGPVVTGSPIGPCETLSPLFQDALGPLEHSVPGETILGLDPLEHSGLDQAGPVGRHVARGPVGPDKTLLGLDPLEHSGPDHTDPAGQHAIFQEVLEPLEHSFWTQPWMVDLWRGSQFWDR